MPNWDGVAYDALPLPHIEWGKRAIAALHLTGDETLLDAGCGTGRDAQVALAQLPKGKLVCVDGSETMLQQCATRFDSDSRVEIKLGDLMQPLPVAPESIDALMSVAALHWLPNHDQVWQHFYRALKPGGRIAIDAGGFGNLDVTLQLAREVDPSAFFTPWNYANKEDTARLLTQAGFKNISVELRPHPTPLPNVETMYTYLKTLVFREWSDEKLKELAQKLPNLNLDYVRLEVRASK
jgi:trans-aconitate 2-methyltransferase